MTITPEHAADLEQLKRAFDAIRKLRTRVDTLEGAQRQPIAIVGIGCRLPGGANSPEAFWQLLRGGVEAVGDIPLERWDADQYYDPELSVPGKFPTRRGGFINGVDQFDAGFFGISPREANAMDPQQRLILETAWEALEDAGIPPHQLAGTSTGVFIGIGLNDYSKLQVPDQVRDPAHIDSYFTSGNVLCIAANRLSYLLDLRGPSLAIDTACSSSLVAVHQAVQSLRRGESSVALVGGTNILLAPETGISLNRMLSPDGRCKFGDAGADGYVRSEGAILMVLKPLAQAQVDGDDIYAVIRGSAVNQDGFSSGLTVPNGVAQQAVLRAALKDAGVQPHDIDYVEAHGTGTSLGDPIEIQALSAVLAQGRVADRTLRVGSVKTNIGHLEAGAGIAGLLKTTLALKAREIPASLHYQVPNPNIPFEQLGVTIQSELVSWQGNHPMAGVSSFGFGGTNSHVIVEAAPVAQPVVEGDETQPQVLVLSARSDSARCELAASYADWLEQHPDASLSELCSTAALGRSHHDYRLALTGQSRDEFRVALRQAAQGQCPRGVYAGQAVGGVRRKIAFLFTGQGSQFPGMGKDLYEHEPAFRAALDTCTALMDQHLGRPLLEIMFAEQGSEQAALLDETTYTQPALFALEYALFQLWNAWGVVPSAVAGHSLGEYVAACVAGVMTLEDACKLVAARGRLMGSLPAGGTMAAVFAPGDQVRSSLADQGDLVSIAAVNGPTHTVISGVDWAVEMACERFSSAGIKVRLLTVSHAFHSGLMTPILDEFEALAGDVSYHAPRVPLVSNLTGTAWPTGRVPDAAYWRRHLREGVQFSASMQTLGESGFELFLEIGPHPVLSGMGRDIAPEGAEFVPSMRSNDMRQIWNALGQLYTCGVDIDWTAVAGGRKLRRLRLPTYAWQHERHWFQSLAPGIQQARDTSNRLHPLIDRRVQSPALQANVFEGEIGVATLPYLDGHRVYGTMILPATALIELAAAAGNTLDGGSYDVAELTIGEALALPEQESRCVQVVLRRDGAGLGVEVVSADQNGTWRKHASGRLTPSVTVETGTSLRQAQADCTDALDIDAFYARFDAQSMQYGPAFRGLERLYCGAGAVLGLAKLPDKAGGSEHYQIHPALMDACLQVAAALFPEGEDTIFLPISLESVRIATQSHSRLWCHARSLPASDSSSSSCALDFFDEQGTPVATVQRVVFRRASLPALRTAIEALGTSRLPLHEVVWQPAPVEPELVPSGTGRWLVFADQSGIGCELAGMLTALGNIIDLVETGASFARLDEHRWTLDPSDIGGARRLLDEAIGSEPLRGVIYLWALNSASTGAHGSESMQPALAGALHLVQALANVSPAPVWFVTRGAQPTAGDVVCPDQAALWGLARTTGREYPDLRPTCIDLDPGFGAAAPQHVLQALGIDDNETEIAFRGGTRMVPRLTKCQPEPDAEPVRLEVGASGTIDGLKLNRVERRAPGRGDVEIRVHATGLNFRDVLFSLGLYPDPAGRPGSECAGVISAVGEGVNDWKPGDRVVAMAEGSFSSYAVTATELVARLPEGLSFAEGATLPIAFITALYSLRELANIQPGMRMLIHSASGGVGLAAVQVAQVAGAQVFATAGNDEKRAYLKSLGIEHVFDSRTTGFASAIRDLTDGTGVDMVLNSLTGDLIRESFDALRDGGCFLEIGKNGIWSEDDVAALQRDIAYHPIYIGGVAEQDPQCIGRILREACLGVETGLYSSLSLRTYPLDRAIDAFGYMSQTRHIGKLVLTQDARATNHESPDLRPDATYLITGGTGGIGLEVARSFVDDGARNIVLVGKRVPSQVAEKTIAELEQQGARLVVMSADVGQRNEVAHVLDVISRDLPPLAGIIHAAGKLDDGTLSQQTWSRFADVFAPKLDAAWHLHELTGSLDLDFFVLFSAGAALIGAPGQANYVSANTAVDALAHWRRARGLPALSINWGPWSDVGMSANLDAEFRRRMTDQGLHSLTPLEGRRALKDALGVDRAQVAAFPVDWNTFARTFDQGHVPSLFRDLVDRSVQRSGEQAGEVQDDLQQRLATLPLALRKGALLRHVREQAARVLGIAKLEDLPLSRPLNELGLDSLMAVDLRNVLGRGLGIALPTTLLFDYPALDGLVEYLLTLLPDGSVEHSSVSDDTLSIPTLLTVDLASLSDEEAEALLLAELRD